jgi:lysophospholipid acyltransferase (LPLAT)-like uncharacterized protein
MPPSAAPLAYAIGRLLALYGRLVVRSHTTLIEGLNLWPRPAIGACWHEGALLGLAVHALHRDAFRGVTFVPPGLLGQAMRGWLDGHGGMVPAELPPDGAGNAQATLKHMARALRDGLDTFVAVDGPHGPAHQVRPGAVWLARLSARPVVPVGFAARPAIRWPKWDRHIFPLPGARVAAIYGTPWMVHRDADLDTATASLAAQLQAVNARAWQCVGGRAAAPAATSRHGGAYD